MRASTHVFQDMVGTSKGPIGFAIDNIEGFVSSGSNWQREHLIRFQVVVFDNQYARAMFPVQYILQNDDNTIKALDMSGFFGPNVDDIVQGRWDSNKTYNNVFLDILGLLRGDSPARKAGIIAITPFTFDGRKIVRNGCWDSPRAKLVNAASIAAMHSGIGRS